MFREPFVKTDVYIRLPDKGMDFIYSVACDGRVIESRVVPPVTGPTRARAGNGGALSNTASDGAPRKPIFIRWGL
jgi:hypothetical protein